MEHLQMERPTRQPERTLSTLTVEARDLDTDARRRTTVEAVPPADPHRQRTELAQAVKQLFPDARLRSFSNGAATFLDSQHLIVAFYVAPRGSRSRRVEPDSAESQEPLFAA